MIGGVLDAKYLNPGKIIVDSITDYRKVIVAFDYSITEYHKDNVAIDYLYD